MIFGIDEIDGSKTALKSSGGRTVSYQELRENILSFSVLSLTPGTAFCMCSNTPGSVTGYLGLMNAGVVPLLLDANLSADPLRKFYDTYRPSWIWCPDSAHENCAAYLRSSIFHSCGYTLWSTGFSHCETAPELALLLATSGSTGNPRLVRLSRENLESNARSICEYLEIDSQERAITTLPMHYTYGLSIINSHLMAGACILMTQDSYVQRPFWEFFQAEKATSFGGVPYTYEILDKLHIFHDKLPSLHYITQAGGKLPPDLQVKIAQWSRENGSRFYVMYGQTEATARMAWLPPEKCLEKPGSIGIAIPGGRFEIQGSDGTSVETPGESGELVYIGPNVSLGYAEKREDLMLGDENHGRLLTGDIAMRDADGYYYIVGRKKRFLKLYGIRVNEQECENILQRSFPSATILCGGSDNHLKIYTTDPEAAGKAADILSSYLHINRGAFSSYLIDRIPRNEYGKIRYSELPNLENSRNRKG